MKAIIFLISNLTIATFNTVNKSVQVYVVIAHKTRFNARSTDKNQINACLLACLLGRKENKEKKNHKNEKWQCDLLGLNSMVLYLIMISLTCNTHWNHQMWPEFLKFHFMCDLLTCDG